VLLIANQDWCFQPKVYKHDDVDILAGLKEGIPDVLEGDVDIHTLRTCEPKTISVSLQPADCLLARY
jgi:hypothetical protein